MQDGREMKQVLHDILIPCKQSVIGHKAELKLQFQQFK